MKKVHMATNLTIIPVG